MRSLHVSLNLESSTGAFRLNQNTRSGFSIVEVAVAAVILAVITISGISLFNSYISNSSLSRLRDEASTLISKDIETLKNKAARLWSCDPSQSTCSGANFSGGSIAFNPPTSACSAKTLAVSAASTASGGDSSFASGATQLAIPSQSSRGLKNMTISRKISHNSNMIVVEYSASSPIALNDIAFLLPPANGWCP